MVNLSYFFSGERGEFFPNCLMVLKGKGVFDVKLNFIEPQEGKKIDEFKERVHGWHFAATDIEHEGTPTKCRAVIDFKARNDIF